MVAAIHVGHHHQQLLTQQLLHSMLRSYQTPACLHSTTSSFLCCVRLEVHDWHAGQSLQQYAWTAPKKSSNMHAGVALAQSCKCPSSALICKTTRMLLGFFPIHTLFLIVIGFLHKVTPSQGQYRKGICQAANAACRIAAGKVHGLET